MRHLAEDLIDYDRYPIATGGPARDEVLNRVRAALDERGCASAHRRVRLERRP
jgi:hypothetical protein